MALFRQRMLALPDSRDIFGSDLDLAQIFSHDDTLSWLSLMARAALLLQSATIEPKRAQSIFASALPPTQQAAFAQFSQGHQQDAGLLLAEFPLLFAMQLAPLFASLQDTWSSNKAPQLLHLVEIVTETHRRISPSRATSENPIGFAAAIGERCQIPSALRGVIRLFTLWHSASPLHRCLPNDVQSRIPSELSADGDSCLLDDAIGGAMILAVHLMNLTESSIKDGGHIVSPSAMGRNNRNINRLLVACTHLLSASVDSFKDACQRSIERHITPQSTTLQPLVDHPIVQVPSTEPPLDRYLVLSSPHIIEGVESRAIAATANGAGRKLFGDLIEHYCHFILRSMFHDRYQPLDATRKRKRADGALWFPNGCILIECKSRQPSALMRSNRYRGRPDALFKEELKQRSFSEAVEQIESTVNDLLRGIIPTPHGTKIKTIGSLIVVPADLPISVLTREAWSTLNLPMNHRRDDVLICTPQITSISDVEELDVWRDIDILAKIEKKTSLPATTAEPLSPYLSVEGLKPLQEQFLPELFDSITAWAEDALPEK